VPRRGRNEEIPEKLSLKINGLIFLRTDNRGAVIFFRSCDDLFFNLHAPHGVAGVKKLLLITSGGSPHFDKLAFFNSPNFFFMRVFSCTLFFLV